MSEKVYGICGTNKCRKEVVAKGEVYTKEETYSKGEIIPKENLVVLTGTTKISGIGSRVITFNNINLSNYAILKVEQKVSGDICYTDYLYNENAKQSGSFPYAHVELGTNGNPYILLCLADPEQILHPETYKNHYINIDYRIVLLKIEGLNIERV